MNIDWGAAAVEVGLTVGAAFVGVKVAIKVGEEKFTTIFKRLDKSDDRHDGHDARFEALNEDFVPRREIEAELRGIRENTEETKKLINWLVFYRVQQQPPAGKLPSAPEVPPA